MWLGQQLLAIARPEPLDQFDELVARRFEELLALLGDQTDASAEKGEQLFEAATEQLVELIEWLRARDAEELQPALHV